MRAAGPRSDPRSNPRQLLTHNNHPRNLHYNGKNKYVSSSKGNSCRKSSSPSLEDQKLAPRQVSWVMEAGGASAPHLALHLHRAETPAARHSVALVHGSLAATPPPQLPVRLLLSPLWTRTLHRRYGALQSPKNLDHTAGRLTAPARPLPVAESATNPGLPGFVLVYPS